MRRQNLFLILLVAFMLLLTGCSETETAESQMQSVDEETPSVTPEECLSAFVDAVFDNRSGDMFDVMLLGKEIKENAYENAWWYDHLGQIAAAKARNNLSVTHTESDCTIYEKGSDYYNERMADSTFWDDDMPMEYEIQAIAVVDTTIVTRREDKSRDKTIEMYLVLVEGQWLVHPSSAYWLIENYS